MLKGLNFRFEFLLWNLGNYVNIFSWKVPLTGKLLILSCYKHQYNIRLLKFFLPAQRSYLLLVFEEIRKRGLQLIFCWRKDYPQGIYSFPFSLHLYNTGFPRYWRTPCIQYILYLFVGRLNYDNMYSMIIWITGILNHYING